MREKIASMIRPFLQYIDLTGTMEVEPDMGFYFI